jgi:orotate phosphoribosyltransferase
VEKLDATILEDLKRDRLVREGHVAFASGRHAAALLDRDHLVTDPVALGHMAYAIAKRFFTDHVDTVASPSIQGAGLALWVAHFLDPKARVVPAEGGVGEPAVPSGLIDLVAGKRLLLIDDYVMSGNLISPLLSSVEAAGGEVIGIAALWNVGEPTISGRPVFGLLNTAYDAWPAAECPICATGDRATDAGY